MSDELQKIDNTNNIISTPDGDIDLSVLPEKERTEILAKYAKDFVDLQIDGLRKDKETKNLKAGIDVMTDGVAKATADQSHATMTKVTEDTSGRSEVIIGNTETAAKGKLTRSQEGKDDKPLIILGGVAGVVILLAIILSN